VLCCNSLQKWYVLANHDTQYWVSPTSAEIEARKAVMTKRTVFSDGQLEQTEAKTWIVFDTLRERIVHEVSFRGTDQSSDPRDVQVQTSVSPSGNTFCLNNTFFVALSNRSYRSYPLCCMSICLCVCLSRSMVDDRIQVIGSIRVTTEIERIFGKRTILENCIFK